MRGDSEYIEAMRGVVDTLTRGRAGQAGGDRFSTQWCIYLEGAREMAKLSLKFAARRKDVPSLLRRHYGMMSGEVLKEMANTGMSCELARASVYTRILRKGVFVKDVVVFHAWRGAAALLKDAGDGWVSQPEEALSAACIGGRSMWEARVQFVQNAVDVACKKRATPDDVPAMFGKYFAQLSFSAHKRSVEGAVPWRAAKKDAVDSVFAKGLPTDPVRAAAYVSANLLLGILPDEASPKDQLWYSTYCTSSGLASERISASSLAGLAVETAAATAAMAESTTPGRIHHGMPPTNGGGGGGGSGGSSGGGGGGGPFLRNATGSTCATPLKQASVTEAFPATAADLGPPAEAQGNHSLNGPDATTTPTSATPTPMAQVAGVTATAAGVAPATAQGAPCTSPHKQTAFACGIGPPDAPAAATVLDKRPGVLPTISLLSSSTLAAGNKIGSSTSQNSGGCVETSPQDLEAAFFPLLGQCFTKNDDPTGYRLPLPGVSPTLGPEKPCKRPGSMVDLANAAVSADTGSCGLNGLYTTTTAPTLATPTPTVQVAGVAATARTAAPATAQGAPCTSSHKNTALACGIGGVPTTTPKQTTPFMSGTAAVGPGTSIPSQNLYYHSLQSKANSGIDNPLMFTTMTGRSSPSTAEAGVVAESSLGAVGVAAAAPLTASAGAGKKAGPTASKRRRGAGTPARATGAPARGSGAPVRGSGALPAFSCGVGGVPTTPKQNGSIVSETTATGLGAPIPSQILYNYSQQAKGNGLDKPLLYTTTTGNSSPSTVEAGVVAAASLGAVGAAAAAVVVTVAAGAQNKAGPTARKRRRGSGASACGSGASTHGLGRVSQCDVSEVFGTKENTPIASGTAKRAAAGVGLGAEATMAANQYLSNCGQRVGAVKYGTSEPFSLPPPKTSARMGASSAEVEAEAAVAAVAAPALPMSPPPVQAAALEEGVATEVRAAVAKAALGGGVGPTTDPAPSAGPQAANTPAITGSVASDPLEFDFFANRPLGPLAPSLDASQAAVTAAAAAVGEDNDLVNFLDCGHSGPVDSFLSELPDLESGLPSTPLGNADPAPGVLTPIKQPDVLGAGAGGGTSTPELGGMQKNAAAGAPEAAAYGPGFAGATTVKVPVTAPCYPVLAGSAAVGVPGAAALDPAVFTGAVAAGAVAAPGLEAGASPSATACPVGQTTSKANNPGGLWVTAELDCSIYGSGGGYGKKRKASSIDGSDDDEAPAKKIRTVSADGHGCSGLTYCGGSGGGGGGGGDLSGKKRKSGSLDGHDYGVGPSKKVCGASIG